MDRKLATKLVHLVNDPETQEDLTLYVDYRVSFLKDTLATLRDVDEIRMIQGAIKELTRFKTLRDEVLSKKD